MPNFLNTYTHPFNEIQILDQSASTTTVQDSLPLHLPLFPLRAAKGRSTPYYCNGTQAIEEYGEQTFDKYEKFYRNEQYYLTNAIFPNQPCWVVRLTPPDAKKASLVIELTLTRDVDIPQYKRDSEGAFLLDENGDKIPYLDGTNQIEVEPGVTVKWTKRQLTDEELAEGYVETKSFQINGLRVKTYPIIMLIHKSAGSDGNRSGFQMYYNYKDQPSDIVDAINANLYNFTPVEQPYNSNVATVIKDVYNGTVNQVSLKENTIDPFTERRLYAEDAFQRLYYISSTKKELLPFEITFFNDNIKEASAVIADYELVDPILEEHPYMVNIFSLTDIYGNPYYHAILDETGNDYIQMNSLSTHYLEGGSDGDISDEAFEELWRQVLKLNTLPDLVNSYKYPITHLYDTGYTIQTKYAMLDFMAQQKRCKVELACQVEYNGEGNRKHLYTMDEAASLGAALRARAAITPESVYYGTPAMRATIYGQSGYVNDTTINNIIPMTYWIALKHAMYHNGTSIRGSWTDYPNNVVDIYRKYNFIPDTPNQREVLWDGATNYFQAATMTTNFMPSIRSIYKDQSSLLSDEEFTDACVYLMAICDLVWVYHVGKVGIPFAKLKSLVENDIDRLSYIAFGDRYIVSSNVYITEGDVQRKDSIHIDTILTGYRPYRRWYNTIICRGEDNAATTSSEI